MSEQNPGDKILHQDDVEEVIQDQMSGTVETHLADTSDHAAISDLAAPSALYVEAEALAARNKINEILDVLRDSGLIPSA